MKSRNTATGRHKPSPGDVLIIETDIYIAYHNERFSLQTGRTILSAGEKLTVLSFRKERGIRHYLEFLTSDGYRLKFPYGNGNFSWFFRVLCA